MASERAGGLEALQREWRTQESCERVDQRFGNKAAGPIRKILKEHADALAPHMEREKKLWAKVDEWKAEAKRVHEMADKARGQAAKDSLMAQSVRYWFCADELAAILGGGDDGGKA